LFLALRDGGGGTAPAAVSPVSEWPDLRDPEHHDDSGEAYDGWLAEGHRLRRGESARWLFGGEVPGTDDDLYVFATCTERGACSRIVSVRDVAMDAALYRSRTQDLGDAYPVFSEYAPAEDAPERGAQNVVFVLAGPRAARVEWASPRHQPWAGGRGVLRGADGAFAANVGWLAAPVRLTVRDAGGEVLHAGDVGQPGDVAYARRLFGGLNLKGYRPAFDYSGQLITGADSVTHEAKDPGPYELHVRCVGTQPLRLFVGDDPYEAPCDGEGRILSPPMPPPASGVFELRMSGTDPYTVYAVRFLQRR
jgi:hypothetical protein